MEEMCNCIVVLQTILVASCFTYEFDSSFACDFSQDTCLWSNTNTSLKFSRHAGETSIDDTGPTAGHTDGGQNDYYIYIDDYGTTNYAELVSPTMRSTCAVACFRFWYHMHGKFVNKMEVGLIHDSNILFSQSGDRGNRWRCGFVPIHSCNDKKIYIRAYESEEGAQSQIAFDDLALTYVDNANECSTVVCNVHGDNFTSTTLTTPMSSTTTSSSTTPFSNSKTSDVSPSEPTSTPTSEPLYLLGLLAVPFVVLAIGIVYIRKRKSKSSSDTNNLTPNNHNRQSQNGYTSDPTTQCSQDSPDGPIENEYLELSDDLKRPDDGDYLHPVGRLAEANHYTNTTHEVYDESNIDKMDDDGYISAVGVAGDKKTRPHNTDEHRALPPLPDMNTNKGITSESQPEVDYPDDGNEDYLHPVSGKALSMPTSDDNDDDYLKPTRSVAIPSRLFSEAEPNKQLQFNYHDNSDNLKRESSTAI